MAALHPGEYTAKLNGLDLWYRVAGQGPVCIVPTLGWGWTSELLIETLKPLEDMFTLVVLETRGTGRSQRPPTTAGYRWADFTADLDALHAHLGQERVWLLGFSHGGIMALQYALAYPDRTAGLLLVCTYGGYSEQWLAEVAAHCGAESPLPELLRHFWFDPPRDPAELEGLPAFVLGTPAYWHDLANAAKVAPLFHRTSVSHHAYQGVADSRQAESDLPAHLPEITVPALIVAGAADGICPLRCAERLYRRLGNSRLLVIEHAGHFPWLEAPAEFFGGVREFLTSVIQA